MPAGKTKLPPLLPFYPSPIISNSFFWGSITDIQYSLDVFTIHLEHYVTIHPGFFCHNFFEAPGLFPYLIWHIIASPSPVTLAGNTHPR